MEKITVPAGHVLIEQGTIDDSLYFLEAGEITIWLQLQNKETRLAKSGAGTIIGEMGFYAKEPRSATVKTETPCVLYVLTEKNLQELEQSDPQMAVNFHKQIIHILSLRLLQMNAALESILK